MQHPLNNSGTLAWSYLALRKAIGGLGTSLPFVLSLGAIIVFKTGMQASLSDYYYTGMRDVFVGTLCAIGVFLFSYEGYTGKDDNDNLVGNFAGVFAIGVALFPTDLPSDAKTPQTMIGIVHVVPSLPGERCVRFVILSSAGVFLAVPVYEDRPDENSDSQEEEKESGL